MSKDIWVFLFGLGLALFSWPIMSIFRGRLIPYLFLAWLLFIGLLWIAITFERDKGER